MNTSHPISETLAAYASGGLKTGARLVLGVHLRACAACRREIERLDNLGGALLADEEPVAMEPGALARTLAALDTPEPPRRLSLDVAMQRGVWLPAGPGVAVKRLGRIADPGEHLFLIRAAGGRPLPEHGHSGPERLVVLTGAFEDTQGRYGQGDLVERGPQDRHQPIACEGETCLCISVTEGPLKLSGIARWVQPMLGV
ncbi:MAG TPA: cupin domain-containing protein [Caulobacteraceae bacterium]